MTLWIFPYVLETDSGRYGIVFSREMYVSCWSQTTEEATKSRVEIDCFCSEVTDRATHDDQLHGSLVYSIAFVIFNIQKRESPRAVFFRRPTGLSGLVDG